MKETYYSRHREERKAYQRLYNQVRTRETRSVEYEKRNEQRRMVRGLISPSITYEQQLKLQNGKCDICKSSSSQRGLSFDHDHVTGNARGLLCQKCNLGLGFFRDNPDFLQNAISYLSKHTKVVGQPGLEPTY